MSDPKTDPTDSAAELSAALAASDLDRAQEICFRPDPARAEFAALRASHTRLLAALTELTEIAGDKWPDRPCVKVARAAIAAAPKEQP